MESSRRRGCIVNEPVRRGFPVPAYQKKHCLPRVAEVAAAKPERSVYSVEIKAAFERLSL